METTETQQQKIELSITREEPPATQICLVGDAGRDMETLQAAHSFGMPVIISETGMEFIDGSGIPDGAKSRTFFVLPDFEGSLYETLNSQKQCILGPPALKHAAQLKITIGQNTRPIYNYAMQGVVTSFTGIRKREELTKMVHLIHSMGGCIKKDLMNTRTTHLICNQSGGEKYQYAKTFRLAVVRSGWVYAAWDERNTLNFDATKEYFTKSHKLKPFEGHKICFFGFPAEDHQHMVDVLLENGGMYAELDDPECSHVVIPDKGAVFTNPPPSSHCSNTNNHFETTTTTTTTTTSTTTTPTTTPPQMTTTDEKQADELEDIHFDERLFCDNNDEDDDVLPESDDEFKEDETYIEPRKPKRRCIENDINNDCSIVDSPIFAAKHKEQKLLSVGSSISRTIKRSVSFVLEPKSKKPRRNSTVVQDLDSLFAENPINYNINNNNTPGKLTSSIQKTWTGFRRRLASTNSPYLDYMATPPRPPRRMSVTPETPLSQMITSPERRVLRGRGAAAAATTEADEGGSAVVDGGGIVTGNVSAISTPKTRKRRRESPPCNSKQNALSSQTQNAVELNNQTVVDEHTTTTKPEPNNKSSHILKSDWFWYYIKDGYANERDYLFGDYLDTFANTPNTADRPESLLFSNNKRKRKRISQRLQLEGTPLGSSKRRSSVSEAGLLSGSNSFFDCTTSPDKSLGDKLLMQAGEAEVGGESSTPAKKSMRFNHFMDFFTTESNYVGILDTILNLFKNKLDELAETENDELLNKSEIKSIFGNFLPIHEVHQSMLEKLRDMHSNWHEDCLIGDIIIQHQDQLVKAYPPYVNFFEKMKEQLHRCDREYPRFHAFLKINQMKPECGRQSLEDLMIRPVQRLPSISLLLNDILKHTTGSNVDHARLEEALKAIKQVMLHINEDKRRTESRMAMFDIFNDIEGCPAHLVSSNRSFISKCEVNELSDSLSGRGDSLLLFLFSDSIELCKRKSRGFNTAKSPSTAKTHKHIKFISLNTVQFVIDITDSSRAFGLLLRDEKENLYAFSITDEETEKSVYVKKLSMQIAAHTCRTDASNILLCHTSKELQVDISDTNVSTLSKAFKLAARTRLKVGRAFSFNKTPNKLKRAVSTIMTSPFGSNNSLTPASQLSQMRLASCTNINEVDDDDEDMRSNSPSTQSVPPLSVQPTRKNKPGIDRI
ncbi:protein ECT2 isoform X2 [Drosophila willistoni]|uniref:protein ECT2 isoform X2 n=1 Tax=Drosophila willistoni TaxID=7260 RepID=UPI00017D829B|nr:protein ECT2 isoform X2 [Drosophila willistoni]